MKLVLLLGLCSLAPLFVDLSSGVPISTPLAVGAIATTLLSIFAAWQQSMGNRSTTQLHEKQQIIEKLLHQLGTDVSDGQDEVSRLSLDPSIRDDKSEDGAAWNLIHNKTTRDHYDQYCTKYPQSRYVAEAESRKATIEEWKRVDQDDPFDINFFLLTSPFAALRQRAKATMKDAIEKQRLENRREYWRQVAVPFHVLLPLFPLIYVVIVAIAMGLYALAGLAVFTPYLEVPARYVRSLAESWKTWPHYENVRPASTWFVSNIDLIVRITLAAVLAVVAWHVLMFILKIIAEQWIGPRVKSIHEMLDEQNKGTYEAVL